MLGLLGVGFSQITTLPLNDNNSNSQDNQNADPNSQPTTYPLAPPTSFIEQ